MQTTRWFSWKNLALLCTLVVALTANDVQAQGYIVTNSLQSESELLVPIPGTIEFTSPNFTISQKRASSGTQLEVRANPKGELKFVGLCVSVGFSLLGPKIPNKMSDDYCYSHSGGQSFRYYKTYPLPDSGVLNISYPTREAHVVYALGLLCELNCGYLAARTQSIIIDAPPTEDSYYLRVNITKPDEYVHNGPPSIPPPLWIGANWNVHPDERFTVVLLCVLEREPGRLTAKWDCPTGEGYYPQPNGYQPLLVARKEPYGGFPPLKSEPHWVKALGIRADGTPVESEPVLVTLP